MTLHTWKTISIFSVAALAAGCAKAPPPAPALPPITIAAPPATKASASMTLMASADTNPDSSGRPSPVVVRVYQLRTDAGFKAAEFFALFDDDQKLLGPELISRDEYMLAPSEQRTINVMVANEALFVGAIAAFRDIRNAEWRGLVAAPRKGLNVSVERARIVLTAVED